MKDLGITSNKVVLFGGGARSKLWKQIIADIFGTQIVTLNVEEGPSYGAAIIAGVGAGIYKNVREATDKIIREDTEVEPVAENVSKYAKYYKVYQSLYGSLKRNFERLEIAVK